MYLMFTLKFFVEETPNKNYTFLNTIAPKIYITSKIGLAVDSAIMTRMIDNIENSTNHIPEKWFTIFF